MNILKDYDYYYRFNVELTIDDYNKIKEYVIHNENEIKSIDNYLNIDCKDCYNCYCCIKCKYCDNCYNCEHCRDCIGCNDCKYCDDCKYCVNCDGCYLCIDCIDCVTCYEHDFYYNNKQLIIINEKIEL